MKRLPRARDGLADLEEGRRDWKRTWRRLEAIEGDLEELLDRLGRVRA
jgi:hypothetical protein